MAKCLRREAPIVQRGPAQAARRRPVARWGVPEARADVIGRVRPSRHIIHRTDGVLGSWTLTESRPEHLTGLVGSVWYFEGSTSHRRERHLPNGLVELVIRLGAPFHFVKDGTRERCATTCLTGLQTGPTAIEAPARPSRALGVRLYPAGAYMVAGCSVSEASGRVVDLEDLIGRAASELAERCNEAPTGEARVQCAAAWVAERIARSPSLDPRVAWAAARIEESHGSVAIAELRDQTGLSTKRLIESFREQIGLAPKLYARVVRFRRALTLLHEGRASLAQIALAAGYYDQAHMNLELRAMGGFAPRAFLASRRYSPTTTVG
jgi:AraC-like DNA-binding protein